MLPTPEVPRTPELRERRESREGYKQAQRVFGPHRKPELFRLDVEALEVPAHRRTPGRTEEALQTNSPNVKRKMGKKPEVCSIRVGFTRVRAAMTATGKRRSSGILTSR